MTHDDYSSIVAVARCRESLKDRIALASPLYCSLVTLGVVLVVAFSSLVLHSSAHSTSRPFCAELVDTHSRPAFETSQNERVIHL